MKNHLFDRLNSTAPSAIDLTKVENHDRKNIFKNYFNEEEKITILSNKESIENNFQNNIVIHQRDPNHCNNNILNDLLDEDEMCRICHSESGILISPCICQGSMGFIHDNCLMEWIKTSGKRTCELCGTKYQAKKQIVWNLMKWSKPQIGGIIYFKLLLLFLNTTLLHNCLSILSGRKFIKRIFEMKLSPRYHDILPICK
uniref:RING-CH-type domain-containing protein n=1 Tax=Strongyloides stercoralis TaxID=6248 RepID=A0AAF5CRA3_STRER